MSAERDVNRIVRSWIRAEEHESADRVLQTVLSRLDSTPQRRPMWSPRRFAQVNMYAKLAAVAAVLVVAVVGYQLIPGISGPGATTSPSPTETPVPTQAARIPADGPIEAGTYQMGSSPTFLITVPAGWVSLGGVSIRKNLDETTEVALDTFDPSYLRVFADACASEGTEQAIGPTAEDLVAALRAQQNSEVSDPVEVTIGGLPASQLEISVPDGLDLAGCSIGGLQIWVDSSSDNYLAFGPDPASVATVNIVDAGSDRLVFVPVHQPDATASDVAELDAIIASIAIE